MPSWTTALRKAHLSLLVSRRLAGGIAEQARGAVLMAAVCAGRPRRAGRPGGNCLVWRQAWYHVALSFTVHEAHQRVHIVLGVDIYLRRVQLGVLVGLDVDVVLHQEEFGALV